MARRLQVFSKLRASTFYFGTRVTYLTYSGRRRGANCGELPPQRWQVTCA